MSDQPETGTVRLHRVLPSPVERVYKAFIDKQALEYWFTMTRRVPEKAVIRGYQ